MNKKPFSLTAFIALLALAAAAGAADVLVFENEQYYNSWYGGAAGGNPSFDAIVIPGPDGTLYNGVTRASGGWVDLGSNGSTNISYNTYLEFEVYVDTDQYPGTSLNGVHMQVNGDGGWTYKWINSSICWVDGVERQMLGLSFTPKTWQHFKLDLTTNYQGGTFPVNPDIGVMHFYLSTSGGTAFYTRNFRFTSVPGGNAAPVVDAGDDEIIMWPVNQVNLDGTVADDGRPDPPATVTTFWEKVSGSGLVTFGDANQVDTTAQFSQPGTYVLQLSADDSHLQTSDTVTITVFEEGHNDPPVVDAGYDAQIELAAGYVDLDGTVTDDGLPNPPGIVTTLWSVISGPNIPGTVTFDDQNAVDTRASFSEVGTYVLRLTADDSDQQISDDVTITVYPTGLVPLYGKFEATFQVSTVATNLQLPYDASPPAGVTPGTGVSVDALFTPDNWQTVYTQPAFYYQEFDHQVKSNRDWIYPTGNSYWMVRFSPNKTGTWKYKIRTTDAGGTTESPEQSFPVGPSENKGFLRVSSTDSRYFEYENGDFFPGLGYNLRYSHLSWNNPVLDNEPLFQFLRNNGMQLFRTWVSHWGIYGSAWWAWSSPLTSLHAIYIPTPSLSIDHAYQDNDVSMRLAWTWNPGMWIGHLTKAPAVKRNTTYHVFIRYHIPTALNGPRIAGNPYGFVAKTCGWLGGDNIYAYCDPGTGTVVTDYAHDQTPDFSILEGSFNSGNNDYIPGGYFMLALENIDDTGGTAVYIDEVEIREDLGGGQYGPNIIGRHKMAAHLSMDQKKSYALDKTLELAEEYDIYLKPVLLEKNEWILDHIHHDGSTVASGSNEYFYGDWRNMTKNRWLQQAWWRYCQARWGYSTKIHGWELLNEGDPWNSRHYTQADEFGKYMHQYVPNDHLVTTSFWNSWPRTNFWINPSYPDIDYGDVHRYDNDPGATYWDDLAANTEHYSMKYGAYQPEGADKPVIRGEVGFNQGVMNDSQRIWMHNFIWGMINSGGMYDLYWDNNNEFSQGGKDPREHFKPFRNFIEDVPLNNGSYEDIAATVSGSSDIRAWGQKDLANGNAHIWIQNDEHTWKNIVDGNAMPPVTGTVEVGGFAPDEKYILEWWDAYESNKSLQVTSAQLVIPDGSGNITLPVNNLETDIAAKITIIYINADINGDGKVNCVDLELLAAKWLWVGTPGQIPEDITKDGTVNFIDFAAMMEQWLDVTGDITGDGQVNYEDLVALQQQWLQAPGMPSADIAPTPPDGIVNFLDFALTTKYWTE